MSEVLRKSMLLLEIIRPKEEKEEWSATEISRELDILMQTVHRLLSSLEEYGFAYRSNGTKKFRLSLIPLKMGLASRDSLAIHKSVLSIVEELTKRMKRIKKKWKSIKISQGCKQNIYAAAYKFSL